MTARQKTVCDCGKPLTEAQISRGGQYCSGRCDGKYRLRGPVKRGFTMEVPKDKTKSTVGPGFREFIDGAVKPVPRD